MQDVKIVFAGGPMAGETSSYDLGSLLIGREPQPEPGQFALVLRAADGGVSRNHAQIMERGGQVILQNLGANGTVVNGKLLQDDIVLKPGDVIAIGLSHEFRVDWALVGSEALAQTSEKRESKPVASSGALSSPLVRALLAVYLCGIGAVALWFSWSGEAGKQIEDEWPVLGAAYASYDSVGIDPKEKAKRARYAEAILVRLRVLRANERDDDVRRLCRELMRLDSDIRSPLYRYGAMCLGSMD